MLIRVSGASVSVDRGEATRPEMTARTLWKYQLGDRTAIEAVARSRAAFLTGLILVLLTAIPRHYDQLAISEQPLRWLFGPLLFSAGSGTFLFVFVYLLRTAWRIRKGDVQKTQGLLSSWVGFMGLFWMTAPIAWLYAIPVERLFESPITHARANLTLLGIVSAWRVCLFARVMQVACRWDFGRAICWVIASACLEVVALVFYSPTLGRQIMAGMGGMRNSPAEDVLAAAMSSTLVGALIAGPVALLLGVFGPWGKGAAALPRRSADRIPFAGLALASIAWIAISILPQVEVLRNARVDRLVRNGESRAALELMNQFEPGAFAPARELPPKQYEWEIFEQLPGLVANMEESDSAWVQDHVLSRLDRMLRHLVGADDQADLNRELDPLRDQSRRGPRWQSISRDAWPALLEGLERTTKGRAWLEAHPNLTSRIEWEAERMKQ